jgi:hypothetical protein
MCECVYHDDGTLTLCEACVPGHEMLEAEVLQANKDVALLLELIGLIHKWLDTLYRIQPDAPEQVLSVLMCVIQATSKTSPKLERFYKQAELN